MSKAHVFLFLEFENTLQDLLEKNPGKNIYQIVMDLMLGEKSSEELTQYETVLNDVFKIYGKDMNQFVKNLLKSINEKLENFTIPKRRKRKISSSSGAEETTKKQKTGKQNQDEWIHIADIWPSSASLHYAELIAALNVAQSIKVWKQLDNFLVSVLNHAKSSLEINENVLFKIDFASNLLCELFNSTRLHEQLMNKKEEVSTAVNEFNKTLHLFYEVILNIEYNSRVMYSFLKLSFNYENFLALFFYHHNPEVKNELESAFVVDQTRLKDEWKIIQQRIKNFGKDEEKNQLNAVIIQHRQKDQLFSNSGTANDEDLLSIMNDDEQIDFLLRKANTRPFVINALEMKRFAQYLTKLNDQEIQSLVIETIALDQSLLDGIIVELIQNDFKTGLEILKQLPLECASEENKKKVFGEILKRDHSDQLQPLIEGVIAKLFKNDSYKMFFKDFTIKDVAKVFEPEKYSAIYHPILSSAARKLNVETLQNFNWILKTNDSTLRVLAQVAAEVSFLNVLILNLIFNVKFC